MGLAILAACVGPTCCFVLTACVKLHTMLQKHQMVFKMKIICTAIVLILVNKLTIIATFNSTDLH